MKSSSFFEKWFSRRHFLAGATLSLATIFTHSWNRILKQPSALPVVRNTALQLDFESGDLSFWTPEGEAFLQQPIRGHKFVTSQVKSGLVPLGGDYWDGPHHIGHQGDYWISTEDHLTGTLTSDEFVIDKAFPWFSFLISGHEDQTGWASPIHLPMLAALSSKTNWQSSWG